MVVGAHGGRGGEVGPFHHAASRRGPRPRSGEELSSCLLLPAPRRPPRPAGEQRLDGGDPRPRKAVHRIVLAGESARSDPRSFSVARPASASTKLMIQKRITTVGSDQPR